MHIVLSSNNISQIVGLERLTLLRVLNLESNQISYVQGLEKCVLLEQIHLGKNELKTVGSILNLSQNPKLMVLDVSNNQINAEENSVDVTSLLQFLEGFEDLRVI